MRLMYVNYFLFNFAFTDGKSLVEMRKKIVSCKFNPTLVDVLSIYVLFKVKIISYLFI